MPNLKKNNGFTLIELVLVIALLSIMLVFAVPRFHSFITPNQTKTFSRWFMIQVHTLKENAARNKQLYILHISLESGKIWVTDESATEEAMLEAEESGYQIPEDLRITDVEYPIQGKVSAGIADICFYKKGYSDKVLVHLEDDDNKEITFVIEPFLSNVKRYEDYIEFEE